ncbi:MAG: FAD-binding oxidoreductase [Gammaproteobacteria bacterium]|nr:MAG: FAD-binding oxidoreductase [Gammaproteobacteria bacterium]UCH41341.1 MAG: FAD-binding oxidoreductase [Gammaproteobacteria bacterium]
MKNPLFTEDCKTTPYWWDNTPRSTPAATELPAAADVVVIGAGYTGLSAALHTARGDRDTVVVDAEDPGWGCSTRNGGHVSTSIKPGFDKLSARYGKKAAFDILKEGHNALAWIEEFIAAEGIECDFRVTGKFIGAHTPAQYERLGREVDNQIEGLESEAWLLPHAEQHAEIGTDLYYGGVVLPKVAGVDPARYHQGLLQRVLEAGAAVVGRCPAVDIGRDGDGFRVTTAKGVVRARDVVVASNGYTSSLTPWLRRRIIPIGSYIIATEPLARGLIGGLVPNDRMLGDTRRMVYYYRASPDRSRILFGGRVSLAESDPFKSGPRLYAEMVRIFPQLAATRISHSWVGFVGYTFDTLPHLGKHDGIHYAMGYCGSGVGMASYLGMRIGQQLLGRKEGQTGFDRLTFETRPLYTGNPWFLAASIMYYRWLDRLNF